MSAIDDLCLMSSIADFVPNMRFRSPAALGAIIRDRRRRLGLEQKALAEKVGVSRQWIINIEKGKPRAALGLVLRTINALGIQLDAMDEPVRCAMRHRICSRGAAE